MPFLRRRAVVRRRRGRRLLLLGGLAAGGWAWRKRQLDHNETAFDHPAPDPGPGGPVRPDDPSHN